MYLLELPPEILGIILKKLDLRSKLCVWNTCLNLRRLLRRPEDARRLNLARCPRLRRALHSTYFRELAPYVVELNLSGLNLENTDTQTLELMTNLQTLDVSYTGMKLNAVGDVCYSCPRLTRLHADFIEPFLTVEEEWLHEQACTKFQNLEFVHFTTRMWNLAILKAICEKVIEFKLSCAFYCDGLIEDLKFNFFMCLEPLVKALCVHIDNNVKHRKLVSRLISDVRKWEFLVTTTISSLPEVYLSENLHREASKTAGVCIYKLLTPDDPVLDEACNFSLFAWHCSLPKLNSNFYENILCEINDRAPQKVCRQELGTWNTNCYLLSPCTFSTNYTANSAENKTDININAFIENNNEIKVSYSKICNCSNSPMHCDAIENHSLAVLKNIVFFSVTDLDLSSDFCKELFKNCNRLETVQIRRHSAKLIENICYSRSVKNIRIIDEIHTCGGNLEQTFHLLSQCDSLENVHVYDISNLSHNRLYESRPPLQKDTMLPFFKNCRNLSNLYICMHNKIKSSVVRAQYRIVKKIRIELDRPDVFFSFNTHATIEDNEIHYHEPHRIYFEQFTLRDLELSRMLKFKKFE